MKSPPLHTDIDRSSACNANPLDTKWKAFGFRDVDRWQGSVCPLWLARRRRPRSWNQFHRWSDPVRRREEKRYVEARQESHRGFEIVQHPELLMVKRVIHFQSY